MTEQKRRKVSENIDCNASLICSHIMPPVLLSTMQYLLATIHMEAAEGRWREKNSDFVWSPLLATLAAFWKGLLDVWPHQMPCQIASAILYWKKRTFCCNSITCAKYVCHKDINFFHWQLAKGKKITEKIACWPHCHKSTVVGHTLVPKQESVQHANHANSMAILRSLCLIIL